jgi:hypothetical protein
LAGAFHHRAAVSLFGWRIPSPRRILFRLPAHLLPIHRFGFAVRPAHLIAAPHSLPFRRRIRRRPTDLVLLFGRRISSPRRILFRLAGAFAAVPPIWCCSVWPAYLPPIHRFGVVPFRRRICRRSTDLVLFHLAGAFPAEPPPIWRCFT